MTAMLTWQRQYYPSGTVAVSSGDRDKPHFGFSWPEHRLEGIPDDEADWFRLWIAADVRDLMNDGGDWSHWMDRAERVSSGIIVAGRIWITPTGPSYDRNPPNLDWRQRPGHRWDLRRQAIIADLWDRIERVREARKADQGAV